MMQECETTPSGRFRHEVRRFFWRNYLAHNIEGGLFMGGMTFLAQDSVMPRLIQSLGGPDWLIALMPTIMFLGFTGPPLLTAHLIERLERVKPLILLTGVFQRIPYLFAGLALCFWSRSHPLVVLILVAGAPLFSGLAGGCSLPAWTELVAKTIPEKRRSSLWAIRFIITALIGFGAGAVIESVLAERPGALGYAILHFYTLGFLVISYLVFMMIRETHLPQREEMPTLTLAENLRSLPELVRSDTRLRQFLLARALATGVFIMTPFLAIHVLEITGRADSFLGQLVKAQMVGVIFGNILGGWLGDRYGGRLPGLVSLAVLAFIAIGATVSQSAWAFLVVYFFFGFGWYMNRVGLATLAIEICPVERRSTYVAVGMTAAFGGMLSASVLCWFIRVLQVGFWPSALLSAVTLILALLFLVQVEEPRRERDSMQSAKCEVQNAE